MNTDQKLDEAIEFIAHSREELKNGVVVVLEGFQHEVKKICDEISAQTQAQMAAYSPKLAELSSKLSVLEQELRAQQTKVQQDIFGLNRKKNALHAYQAVNHSHKPNNSESNK